MIPDDSRVEIDAKINAGYFTTGAQVTEEQLKQVKGRGWEKWEDIAVSITKYRLKVTFLTFDAALSSNSPKVVVGNIFLIESYIVRMIKISKYRKDELKSHGP